MEGEGRHRPSGSHKLLLTSQVNSNSSREVALLVEVVHPLNHGVWEFFTEEF